MREFATEFPVGDDISRARFLALVWGWLRGKDGSVVLDGYTEADLEGETPRLEAPSGEVLSFRQLEEGGGQTLGFRHDTPDGEKVWRTEAVYHKKKEATEGIMRVRVQCLAVRGLPELKMPKKPYFIKTILEDGWAQEDVLLQVQERSHTLSDDMEGLEIATSITSGQASKYLPVVYISCGNDGRYPLSPRSIEALAYNLGGVAHVVIEPSRSFSFRLKEASSGGNVYAGSIGIFLPKKGLVRRFFLGGFLPKQTDLFEAVKAEAIQLRSLMAQNESRDWVQLQESHLRALRERQKNQLSSAESEELWQEELAAKEERIKQLEEKLEVARNVETIVSSEGILDDAFVSVLGPEIYESEFSDRVRAALVDCVERGADAGWDKRSIAIFGVMLEQVEFSGRAKDLQRRIGVATKDSRQLSKKVPELLREIGYETKSEKTHIRMEARSEMIGLGTVTIPKSPSEWRGLKNQKSQLVNTLGLRKLS